MTRTLVLFGLFALALAPALRAQAPDVAPPHARPHETDAGRAVLDAAVEASGGKAAFASFRSMRMTGTVTVPQMGGAPMAFTQVVGVPDLFVMRVYTPTGVLQQIYSDGEARVRMDDLTLPPEPEMVEQLQSLLWRNLAYLFAAAERVAVQDLGPEFVDGTEATVLQITPPEGTPFRLVLDAGTRTPLRIESREQGIPVTATLLDYREVDGRRLPFRIEATVGGRPGPTTTVGEIAFDVAMDESLFGE